MDVLVLTWNYPPVVGGIEHVAARMRDGLAARGHTVRVLTRHAVGADDPSGVTRAARPGLAGFILHGLSEGTRACRRRRPDVLLCATVVAALPARWLAWRWRIPYVVLAHGSDVGRGGRLYRAVVGGLLRGAARVCANSRGTAALLPALKVKPDRVAIVYPGVDVLPPAKPLARWGDWSFEGRRVMVTVGRLIRRKGVLEFIERVLSGLVARHPTLCYVVVGEDATESLVHNERLRDRLVAAVASAGLERHVCLAGHLPDEALRGLLARADLFVLPARPVPGDVEGFGIVFSEAALAGVPVVATRLGGIPEAVEDGVSGILTEPDDDAALGAAIARLLGDEPARLKMGAAGAARARRHFAWEAIAAEYEAVLRDVAPPPS